jgi:glycosyltransferase involved in cell wall biosynthesis
MESSNQTLEGQVILCLSDSPWESPISGRQRVMSRLAKRNQVYYVDPPPHLERLFKPTRWSDWRLTVTGTVSGVQIIRFPAWAGYTHRPALERRLAWLRALLLKAWFRRRGQSPLLYVWHPFNWSIVQHFDNAFVCFHVYDDYKEFAGVDRDYIARLDEQLTRRADLLIGVSESLVADRQPLARAAHVVHNGADYAAFANENIAVPSDLDAVPRPRAVYVARLNLLVDFSVLERLAQQGDVQIVVVGPLLDLPEPQLTEARRVLALPNIHWLGERPAALVPGYVRHSDACLIAYRLNEVTRAAASPQKLFEYLSTGRPVVSAALPLMRQFEPEVRFAISLDDWPVQLRAAIDTDTRDLRKRRQELAAKNSWDAQVERIGRIVAGRVKEWRAGHRV